MSQEKLADQLGLTFQQVQKYEKGTNRVGASRLQQTAAALNSPVAFFFEGAPAAKLANGHGSAKVNDDDAAVTPDIVNDFVASREGLDFIKAFAKISDSKVRRSIVTMAETVAASRGSKR